MNHLIMQEEKIRQGRITPRYAVFLVSRNETTKGKQIKHALFDIMDQRVIEEYEDKREADGQCTLLNLGVKLT